MEGACPFLPTTSTIIISSRREGGALDLFLNLLREREAWGSYMKVLGDVMSYFDAISSCCYTQKLL